MNANQVVRSLALVGSGVAEEGARVALAMAGRTSALGLALAARGGLIGGSRLSTAVALIATLDRVSPEIARQAGNLTAAGVVIGGGVATTMVRGAIFTAFRIAPAARFAEILAVAALRRIGQL